MSGRAGRRGKDTRGICIIMIDEQVLFFFLFQFYVGFTTAASDLIICFSVV